MKTRELLPQGAEIVEGGVRYRIWVPDKSKVEIEVNRADSSLTEVVPLAPDSEGYYQVVDPRGRAGDRYKYKLGGDHAFPDPSSRSQPDGVHGPSMVIDPRAYDWNDAGWHRPAFRDLVIYELHIGAFTPVGTFRAAIEKLSYLRDLGINAIEIMPVADFPGARNWGYDGVSIYAPARCYGTPDDMRALVDAAHAQGIAVVLDVVYNHLGPDGNYLGAYSPFYFTKKHKTPWGDAFNFDGENSAPVRSFFLSNAIYWLEEFHIDGLRLDATHAIRDDSEKHLLEEMADAARERGCYIFAEDERNQAAITMRKPKGFGMNATYADDFCHTIQVALGDTTYKDDFTGTPAELADELRHGWLYRGQATKRTGKPRGTDCGHLPPENFLYCISNHDQTGNRALGERLNQLASPEAYRAASALLLLSPYTSQIFMGQEWAASTPFLYFTDHNKELGRLVSKGRRKEFFRMPEFADSEKAKNIPDPQSADTFEKSKLKWEEREQEQHACVLALYRECLRMRTGDPVFRPEGRENWKVQNFGMVALHYRNDADWLVLVDLAGGNRLSLTDEEFCALRMGKKWSIVLSTNEKRFGGNQRKSFDAGTEVVIFNQPELLVLKS